MQYLVGGHVVDDAVRNSRIGDRRASGIHSELGSVLPHPTDGIAGFRVDGMYPADAGDEINCAVIGDRRGCNPTVGRVVPLQQAVHGVQRIEAVARAEIDHAVKNRGRHDYEGRKRGCGVGRIAPFKRAVREIDRVGMVAGNEIGGILDDHRRGGVITEVGAGILPLDRKRCPQFARLTLRERRRRHDGCQRERCQTRRTQPPHARRALKTLRLRVSTPKRHYHTPYDSRAIRERRGCVVERLVELPGLTVGNVIWKSDVSGPGVVTGWIGNHCREAV